MFILGFLLKRLLLLVLVIWGINLSYEKQHEKNPGKEKTKNVIEVLNSFRSCISGTNNDETQSD